MGGNLTSIASNDNTLNDQFYELQSFKKLFFQIVHPKSDVQRKSLLEAVKEILLFRSLDTEQVKKLDHFDVFQK
jgi:hypothetical protein